MIAKALDIGPPAFYGAAAAVAGLEGLLFANNVQVPFIGLAAGGVLGLVLIPLTLVLVIVGAALGSLKD